MKKILLLLLMVSATGTFAQTASETEMLKKLKLMHYLDDAAMQSYAAGSIQGFYKGVFNQNPVPEISVNAYLGVTEPPQNSTQFVDTVNYRNAESLLQIIQTEGYPSYDRIRALTGQKNVTSAAVFMHRATPEQKKQFKKVAREEFKKGNMSEQEYDLCMKFIKTDGVLTASQVLKFNAEMQEVAQRTN
ncbi:MAG: hypothetical protein ACO1N9_10580 [Flavobacterium sp.]